MIEGVRSNCDDEFDSRERREIFGEPDTGEILMTSETPKMNAMFHGGDKFLPSRLLMARILISHACSLTSNCHLLTTLLAELCTRKFERVQLANVHAFECYL